MESPRLAVEVPGDGYHRGLIACQVACPVHTDARGYVRAIAAGDFETAVIEALGFEIRCGVTVGKDVTFARLRAEHAAE